MKDSKLQIDRSCHVLYSKPCKKEILAKIALHHPEAEREAIFSITRMSLCVPFIWLICSLHVECIRM